MPQQPLIDSLTPRERDVLILIAEGYSLPEIAQQLHRSLKTIESHRLSLGRKLNAANRVELARIAIAQGLVSINTEDQPAGPTPPATHNPEQELRWLADISEAVSNVNGQRYFDAMCNAFSRAFGVRLAAVCFSEPLPSRTGRYTVAMSDRGNTLAPVQYDMSVTPVVEALEHGVSRVHADLTRLYPDDLFALANKLESYIGIRLLGDLGGRFGVMSVMHDRPMPNAEAIERVMRFFLARTSAELERLHRAEELNLLRQQLASHHTGSPGTPILPPPSEGVELMNVLLAHTAGERLLSDLTDTLCNLFGARFCGVCINEKHGQQPNLLTLAFSEHGRQRDPIEYPISDTPCAKAEQEGYFFAPRDVADQFPNDRWLKQTGIQSYFGINLNGLGGESCGVMWLVDDKPRSDENRIADALRYLSPRVSVEVDTLARIERLREENERLEAKIAEQHG